MPTKIKIVDTITELEDLLNNSDDGLFITDGSAVPMILTAFAVTMQAVNLFTGKKVKKEEFDLLLAGVIKFSESDPVLVAEMMEVMTNFVSRAPSCPLH